MTTLGNHGHILQGIFQTDRKHAKLLMYSEFANKTRLQIWHFGKRHISLSLRFAKCTLGGSLFELNECFLLASATLIFDSLITEDNAEVDCWPSVKVGVVVNQRSKLNRSKITLCINCMSSK